ncbi:MAG: 1-acyl-sn-glycerol-3-phosphate acyltransferase [Bacteroidales bacterium]|nr:1-acyl-sn-glycerol-3-phosphate acyltransferase [Bacteroidales bacterium]
MQKLDIKKIIRGQENKIVRKLPNFIINFLKKSFHQKEINVVLRKNEHNFGIDFVRGVVKHLNLKTKTYNEEAIPSEGKFIFAGNHSLGGVDFAVLIDKIYEKFKDIKILANEMFLFVENTKELFLPVSILKSNEKHKKDAIEEHLAKDDGHLLIFPAGKVARKIKGKMDDGPWHRSFIRNAIEHKRDIIPIFIGGENSKKFYRLAKIRKFFRIKANLELFLLPGEVFKQKNATIPIVYGTPIPYTTFNDSKTHIEWAQEVKKIVYNLEKKFLLKEIH